MSKKQVTNTLKGIKRTSEKIIAMRGADSVCAGERENEKERERESVEADSEKVLQK